MTSPDTSAALQGSAVAVEPSPNPLDPSFTVGQVALRVANLERARAFWTKVVGLVDLGDGGSDRVVLGVGSRPLVELVSTPDATAPPTSATGLYHLALRVPTRRDLAIVMQRVTAFEAPVAGASDHGVSEALYLDDPEGNGIEIYHDRPANEWHWGKEGTMIAPMDIKGIMSTIADDSSDELVAEISGGLPTGTDMGHVHLKVADVDVARAWYRDVFGLDITLLIPGGSATFASAGGYHHHVGMNTWHSRGGHAPAPDTTGLDSVTAHVASRDEALAIAARAGVTVAGDYDPIAVVDPAGNTWRLVER